MQKIFKNQKLIKIIALMTYIIMVVVNALANILPINGISTGEISDSYPNLFAPAGITFSIWGLIYLLLGVYSIYQLWPKSKKIEALIYKINLYFILSSIVNAIWIFLWHYQLIGLSVLLMLVILYALIKISSLSNNQGLGKKGRSYIKIPFGVYFGWITVAAIANITAFLVSVGWRDFIFADQVWTVIILVIGTLITSLTTIKEKNLNYGLVPIWAYLGIYLKHTSAQGFNNNYPSVVLTTIVCLTIFVLVNGYLLAEKQKSAT